MKPLLLLACVATTTLHAQTYTTFKTTQRDTFYGRTVDDPYRKLEDTADSQVKTWMQEQNNISRRFFDGMPGRAALAREVEKQMREEGSEEISEVHYFKGQYYVVKRYPKANNFSLYRINKNGHESLLIDPDKNYAHLKSKNLMLSGLVFNPLTDQMGFGITVGGYEVMPKMVLRDLRTGREQTDTLFLDGQKGQHISNFDPLRADAFYYKDFPLFNKPGVDPGRWWDSARVYYHIVGNDRSKDELIVDFDPSVIKRGVDDDFFMIIEKDLPFVFAIARNTVLYDNRIYVAPKASFKGLQTPWKMLTDYPDKVKEYAAFGNYLYLIGQNGASNGRLQRIDLQTGITTELLPHSKVLLRNIKATREGLLVSALQDGTGKLFFIPHGSTELKTLALPFNGFVNIMSADRSESDFVISISSWTHPTAYFDWKASEGRFRNSVVQRKLLKPDVELEQKIVMVKSHDGVEVPMTIVHKKGLKLDGTHPVSMRGYGSYGMLDHPGFWPEDAIFYNNGGIRAVAHVRGGGVYGEEWHVAGQKANKPNTWKDFIACGEYLIKQGYAKRENLIISGGSAGGITVGRAITERPDLFGAAIIRVGALDMVRFEKALNGPGNIPEFGSIQDEAGFKALYEMSAYHHVKEGTPYPAVLFVHGVNDNRVPVWTSLKMAARLQEASTSGQPIMMRLDYDSGHGMQEPLSSLITSMVDNMCYLFWRAGKAGFTPKKEL